jgi:hypothetical protein
MPATKKATGATKKTAVSKKQTAKESKPVKVPKPPPEPPVGIDEVDEDFRDELKPLLLERGHLKEQEAYLKARLADNKKTKVQGLNSVLMELQKMSGQRSVLCPLPSGNTLRTTIVDGTSVSLSKERLLKEGVAADVIAKCYVTKNFTTIQTTLVLPGQDTEEEEE